MPNGWPPPDELIQIDGVIAVAFVGDAGEMRLILSDQTPWLDEREVVQTFAERAVGVSETLQRIGEDLSGATQVPFGSPRGWAYFGSEHDLVVAGPYAVICEAKAASLVVERLLGHLPDV